MPELTNREELEADFAKRFGKVARRHMHEFREWLGDPPNINNVPEEFWAMCEHEMQRDNYILLLLIFSTSAIQHGWDGAEMRLAAAGFAKERSGKVAENWIESTRRMFGEKLDKARKDNQEKPSSGIADHMEASRTLEPTREQVDDILDDLYGAKRIHVWAVDETTRARHAGSEEAIENTVGLSEEDIWRTEDDSSVCPICRPLDGKPRSYWARFFPEGPPDPHARCRCFIEYSNVPAEELVDTKN